MRSNPWQRFTWIEPPKKKIEQFQSDDLLNLLLHFRTAWPGVTAAEAMLKVFVWSWARREQVAGLKWDDLRVVEDEYHFDTVGKRGKEWWFRIPKNVHEELLGFKTESPYVFAKLMDQIREFHATEGRKSAAKMVREFTVYNAGRWFYEQVKKWDGEAYVHKGGGSSVPSCEQWHVPTPLPLDDAGGRQSLWPRALSHRHSRAAASGPTPSPRLLRAVQI